MTTQPPNHVRCDGDHGAPRCADPGCWQDDATNASGQLRAADLMRDGQWHHAQEIIEATGQREGLRRMRQLRGCGWTIERRRVAGDRREFEYRATAMPLGWDKAHREVVAAPAPAPAPGKLF